MSGDEHKAVTGLMSLFVGATCTTHTTLNALILQVLQISTKEHNTPPCDAVEAHCYVRYRMNFAFVNCTNKQFVQLTKAFATETSCVYP